ncbi:MAG: hemerythrin domain-containing protein [Azonexus sp.]|nr:hemerythrin domain-containing protein [Azonexus sp.]
MSLRDLLTENHRHCDDLFAEAEMAAGKGRVDTALAAFSGFAEATLAHFSAEELTLFPAFEAQTGMTMGPTQVMRMEHEQMRSLIQDAVDALKQGNTEDFLGISETLLIMMQQHNMKEENVLYPMCDQHLSAEVSSLLARIGSALHQA